MRSPRRHHRKVTGTGIVIGVFAALWPASSFAQQPVSNSETSPQPPVARLNSTDHALPLNAPLMRGSEAVASVDLVVYPDDHVTVRVQSLLSALHDQVSAAELARLTSTLAGKDEATFAEVLAAGVTLHFDAQTLEVTLDLAGGAMAVRQISLRPRTAPAGDFTPPSGLSGFLNLRSSIDHDWDGNNRDPIFAMDGALRAAWLVFEAEGGYRPARGAENEFVRDGTRLVFDDRSRLMRWTAGDLETEGRGFQSAPTMAGISVSRSYQRLDPTRNVYPRGQQSFTLQRDSTVSVIVNGQRVDSLQLGPGAYNLSDFPFFYGANSVELQVEDEVGRRELVQFELFFDRQLLQPGATEFGAYAGVASTPGQAGPRYDSRRPEASGFFRTGVSDSFTFGANAQGDEFSQQAGIETVVGARHGLLGLNVAISNNKTGGAGYAVNAVAQTRADQGVASQAVFIGVDYRSAQFASVGEKVPFNPFTYQVFGGYSRALGPNTFFSATINYSAARNGQNVESVRAGFSRNFNSVWTGTLEAVHQRRVDGDSSGVFISLSRRLGPNSSARASYDSSVSRGSVDLYTSHGEGVGSWYATADFQSDANASATNASVQYEFNRGEVTLDHFSPLHATDGDSSQRTSLRIASSFVFANGAWGVGRPIYDAFAVISPHASLHGARVEADIRDSYYEGRSGILGGAVVPNIASYADRSVAYDVPKAPEGYDLGAGSIRTFAPYHGGYGVIVGSDYSVTAMGRLLDSDGAAISLLAGTATEVAHPERAAITIFTNRDGRFLAAGVKPGRWTIRMPTTPPTTAEIVIPGDHSDGDHSNLVQLGDVKLN